MGPVLPSHIRRTARCDSSNFPTIHKIETFPLLEIRAMNGGVWLAIRRLIRGSAFTKAAAISVPCIWLEVSTKARTLADANAVRSVAR